MQCQFSFRLFVLIQNTHWYFNSLIDFNYFEMIIWVVNFKFCTEIADKHKSWNFCLTSTFKTFDWTMFWCFCLEVIFGLSQANFFAFTLSFQAPTIVVLLIHLSKMWATLSIDGFLINGRRICDHFWSVWLNSCQKTWSIGVLWKWNQHFFSCAKIQMIRLVRKPYQQNSSL